MPYAAPELASAHAAVRSWRGNILESLSQSRFPFIWTGSAKITKNPTCLIRAFGNGLLKFISQENGKALYSVTDEVFQRLNMLINAFYLIFRGYMLPRSNYKFVHSYIG